MDANGDSWEETIVYFSIRKPILDGGKVTTKHWDMFNAQPPITLAFLVPILHDKCSHMIM